MAALVEASGLSFRYGAQTALDQVSLQASEGEIVGLVGPNGAGKSTLVRCLAGLAVPVSGQVRLAGLDPFRAARTEVARACAYVPQEPAVAWPFTVREAVMMGRAPRQGLLSLPGAADAAVVERALADCDLTPFSGRRMDELSGGERRRVFFARALAQEPRVLLLDEPTAFLDLRHQLSLLTLARRAADRGLAVVAVLHDLNLAAASCDRLVALAAGRVAAEGPPGEVLTAERVSAIWGVPVWRGTNAISGAPVVLPAGEIR
jgi:iron complex transport system ATP-binding protein